MHNFRCFAQGTDGDWEAICVDLDIAVQGDSFENVKLLLDCAISTYIEDAMCESPEVRSRLLSRKAPWTVIAKHALDTALYNFRQNAKMKRASYPVACHA